MGEMGEIGEIGEVGFYPPLEVRLLNYFFFHIPVREYRSVENTITLFPCIRLRMHPYRMPALCAVILSTERQSLTGLALPQMFIIPSLEGQIQIYPPSEGAGGGHNQNYNKKAHS